MGVEFYQHDSSFTCNVIYTRTQGVNSTATNLNSQVNNGHMGSFVTTAHKEQKQGLTYESTLLIGPVSSNAQLPTATKATVSQRPQASGIKDKLPWWDMLRSRTQNRETHCI